MFERFTEEARQVVVCASGSPWGMLERIRQQRASERDELIGKLSDVRAKKQQALDRQEFKSAARLRDKERELSARFNSEEDTQELLREVRRRLGLSGKRG